MKMTVFGQQPGWNSVVEADHSLGGLSDEPVDPGPHVPCNLVMDYETEDLTMT